MRGLLILTFVLITSLAQAATFESVMDVPSKGWIYTFQIKTKGSLVSTPTTIYTKNCLYYITRPVVPPVNIGDMPTIPSDYNGAKNFAAANELMNRQRKIKNCFDTEADARAYAQQAADKDEQARSDRGESTTNIEVNRIKQKVMQ